MAITASTPTAWLNKSQLDLDDLPIIHGLLCQMEQSPIDVLAMNKTSWKGSVGVEWGVRVVVIRNKTGKMNWLGKPIFEESRITLDALAYKIGKMSEMIHTKDSSEYQRSLGLHIHRKLTAFEKQANRMIQGSYVSRFFQWIRNCSCFTRKKTKSYPLQQIDYNFRRYTIVNFHDRIVKERDKEFDRLGERAVYRHPAADGLFQYNEVHDPSSAKTCVYVKTEAICKKARFDKRKNCLINDILSPISS